MEVEITALPRPETIRTRKPILSPISRATDALLDSLLCDVPERRRELRDWADNLIGEVRQYTNGKGIRRGMFAPPILSKAQAEAALCAALAGEGLANDR